MDPFKGDSMNLNCLIVDDEEGIQRTISAFLKQERCLVSCASDYQQAEEMIKQENYDLIFLDIFLGKNCGLNLLKEIRAHKQDAMVVMITGLPDMDSITESLRLGAFDFLAKPFSYPQVITTAQRAQRIRTAAMKAERKQANLDAIFRSASDAILLVDKSCQLLQYNEAALRLCGFTADNLNQSLHDINFGCSDKCRILLDDVLNNGATIQAKRFECSNSSHTKRLVSFSASPVINNNGLIDGAVAFMRDETQLAFLEKQLNRQNGYAGIVGKSNAMQKLYSLIDALTDVQTTVLINGESGTGKELVASALHHQGARRSKPFIKVNCSALSEHLLESELFGHVRGAFTGAISNKIGRFKMADGGTIFLDEIGDISMAMQIKLLRVLQEHEFEQVGDSRPIKVNVRVLAATHHDLAEKVKQGTFRHDLYYRLNVVRLIIPPPQGKIGRHSPAGGFFPQKIQSKVRQIIFRRFR